MTDTATAVEPVGTATATATETIVDAFDRTAREHAAREALSDGVTTWTYAELDAASDRIACALADQGLRPGERVGVHLERCLATYPVFLGVLKAGLVVVPFNPDHPADHRARMCEIADPVRVVTVSPEPPDGIPPRICVPLDELTAAAPSTESPRPATAPDDPAFVLFSSGSTGDPKAVVIAHRGIARVSRNLTGFTPGPDDRFLQLAQPAFAASTTDIWACLLRGGRLTVAPQTVPQLGDLARLVARERTTVMNLSVGLFDLLVEHHPEALAGTRWVIVSGDFPSARHLGRALDAVGGALFNAFGCTENSALTAVHRVTGDDLARDGVPVGLPMPGVGMTVRDEALDECPPGVIGELCLDGDGLALGYHGDPELTARKFVRHRGRLLLRTGDLAKRTDEGEIVLAGRTDQMLKIRGYRVEPRHVEVTAETAPGVRQAVAQAVPGEGAADRLALWCVPAPGHDLSGGDVTAHLRERLPDHLVPSEVRVLDAFPLNANGKIDRRELSSRLASTGGRRAEEPGTDPGTDDLVDVVGSTLRDVSGRDGIGPDDGLFESGVTSLHLIDLGARLEDALGVALAPDEIGDAATVRGVAETIRTARVG